MTDKACYAGQSEIKGSNGDSKQHSALRLDGIRLDRLDHRWSASAGAIAIRHWDDRDLRCDFRARHGWLLTVWHMPDVIAQQWNAVSTEPLQAQ